MTSSTPRLPRPALTAALLLLLFPALPLFAAYDVEVSPSVETGFSRALHHDIQIGEDTYRFDYVKEGGQEILSPFHRLSITAVARDTHEVSLLYQPLTLNTRTRVDNPGGIVIDDVTFGEDTPLDLQYGFDFYRLTYRYRVTSTESWSLSVGGAFQIRNASIIFDGYDEGGAEARVITQDLGPVPVLSLAARRTLVNGAFFESTVEGFFAPIRYLNLRDADVIGWLYDVALRAGVPVAVVGEAYVSARFLGGGADGTAKDRAYWTQSRSEPRYTWNNLNLAVLSFGLRVWL